MRDRPLKVRFCGDCGRMILVGFEYCPYCGSQVRLVAPPPEPPASPEASKNPVGIPQDFRDARILLDRLIRDLETLDAEMEELLAVKGEQ